MSAEQGGSIEAHARFVEQRWRDVHAGQIGPPSAFQFGQGLADHDLQRLPAIPAA